ncbi:MULTISPECIES: polyphosphate kinase 1 [unclassified Halanaerobium]|uniref:polyphosphate kinase 1 n=1 Tax=unclassified Halanaerobium TaxID=2641197 RepID=UPI000DF157EC|nr:MULTISPECIES: polyphosphate kinase 1 [unclassified Halanaerobium]RCW46334.1 polyphosphate kinase [Halanaerobium sp. MA284_MarDTE_T2]RCW82544.1 polyphosphate kinase [Halanaerobium sp. DL-01]
MNLDNSNFYLNKLISWLKFNIRVLEEANVPETPLLEKLKFLAITSTNLDEFFMVRVARLKYDIESGYNEMDKSGYLPRELFNKIADIVHDLYNNKYNYLQKTLKELESEKIYFKKYKNLNKKQKAHLDKYFDEIIFPVLTPVAIDTSHPFPLISNKSLNLGVMIEKDKEKSAFSHIEDQKIFSVVEVPANLKRFFKLTTPENDIIFVLLEDIIKNNIKKIFSGNKIIEVCTFRITRNAEVLLDEESENLLNEMERYIKRRRWGFAVRLEINSKCNDYMLNFLKDKLNLDDKDIYNVPEPVNIGSFMNFSDLLKNHEHLKFKKLIPQPHPILYNSKDLFKTLKEEDIILHHPFEQFDYVIDLVKNASRDPGVLAIKQTLYRISGNSPLIEHLIKAAENGKQVTVLVELKARFDEEKNIEWAKKLEEAGCHVIYGIKGLKVHVKALLIVRLENEGIKRYVHLSTGNYNDKTAKLYTDIGFMTSKESFASDVSALFNLLTGYSKPPHWKLISVAPLDLRENLLKLIDNEIKNAKNNLSSRIIAKMNALIDTEIIKKLYQASQAGVKIDLIVRGICCLRPGVKGLSDNIRVISIIGKLLEHSRIFYFSNNNDPYVFLSSADWRPRNFDRRVEIAFPVEKKEKKNKIINILCTILKDNKKAYLLKENGKYIKIKSENPFDSQLELYKLSKNIFQTEFLNNNFKLPQDYIM